MIRTGVVTLTCVEGIGYRQKLKGGEASIVVLLKGDKQPGIAAISKTSGEAIPSKNTRKNFPVEAFAEAIKMTAGMPYKNLKGVKYVLGKVEDDADNSEVLPEVTTVESKDYEAIVAEYTDKNGKLSYDLINKDMIKFAHSSSIVRNMVAEKVPDKKIVNYVVGSKFRNITDNHNLSDAQVAKIVELLDEVSPKGVLKEFKEEVRKSLK